VYCVVDSPVDVSQTRPEPRERDCSFETLVSRNWPGSVVEVTAGSVRRASPEIRGAESAWEQTAKAMMMVQRYANDLRRNDPLNFMMIGSRPNPVRANT